MDERPGARSGKLRSMIAISSSRISVPVRGCPLITATLALLLPAVSSGAYRQADIFRTPDRSTYCLLIQDPQHGGGARCFIAADAPGGNFTFYEIHEKGSATKRTRQDVIYGAKTAPAIHYGQTFAMTGGTPKVGPIKGAVNCTSRRSGLTCSNRSGHGFTLTAKRQRRF